MTSTLDRAAWLAQRQAKGGRPSWTKTELDRLHTMVGKYTLTEMAEALGRKPNVVALKLGDLGYSLRDDVLEPLGCTAEGLARHLAIPREVVHGAIRRGQIKAVKKDRKEYLIRWPEVRRFQRWLDGIRARRARVLARIKVETITKQAFMKLLSLSETHVWRYLNGGIVKAWKVPCLWQETAHYRWEWVVSEPDALRVKARREAGKLRLGKKKYRQIVTREFERINELRRRDRLGKRDDLKHALSPVIEGHYTVRQVASHAGLSCTVVYSHIALGRLEAQAVRVGNRTYRAVHPDALKDYLAWTKRQQTHTGPPRPHQRQIEAVRKAGLLTIADAAARYHVGAGTLRAAVCQGRVPSRKIAGMRGLRAMDVRNYARTLRKRKQES